MPKFDYNIFQINDPAINSVDALNPTDSALVDSFEVKNVFNPADNFVEINFFSLQNNLLLSDGFYNRYKVLQDGQSAGRSGASIISVDVLEDVKAYGYDLADVRVVYNFLSNVHSNINDSSLFYLENISSDRTEVRLLSTKLSNEDILTKTRAFKDRLESQAYITEFSLYSGNNRYITAINIDTQEYNGKTAVILKLYQPLPNSVQLKDSFSIVEKLCDSPAYEVDVTITSDPPVIPTLRTANFNIDIEEQSTEPSGYYNYNELFSFPVNNSNRELNSLFNEKGAELSIDYSDFSNFINFSSAEERVRNFKYKFQLIESYQASLDAINNDLTNYTGAGVSGSREYFEGLIKGVLDNFDHYERHLYYESGSTSWPKQNDSRPYINVGSTTGASISWFNGQVASGSNYDLTNPDILINSIPSYLKEDPDNDPYLLFIHMIGQHFDNLWVYTDSVSKKYDADNRLNRGVAKDLVEDLLKNFGVKLYTSNQSVRDLYRYFTADSYELDDFEPNLDPIITGSNYAVSQKTYQQEIYKRIYHNLPLLMKSKGTERGLRALINCFGIPSDVLKIRLYGGQSSEDLPFFGGQQAFTGSLDKVRLNNTGSIVEGDTISEYTSIIKQDNFFTQDLHTIEVGFSPTHNVDTYILSQSAVLFPSASFDIDDYIGDPREISTNSYFYLRDYADQIFAGVDSYDLRDFVRFIKFFDNVIFRMVRDFIPARTVADTGIIIKPHLLERSKYEAPVMSWTQPEYTGSINTAFISGSPGGVYESFATGSVSGSLITSYVERVQTPTGTVVHSWTDSNGNTVYTRGHEEARYDGQLSGSSIVVTDGELNRENNFKTIDYKETKYNIRFIKEVPANACLIQSVPPTSGVYSIVRPEESPYNLSSLFLNAPLSAFEFTVDGGPVVTDPQAYDFDFDSVPTNYTTGIVTAISSSTTSPDCTATTRIIKVICDAFLNTQIAPDTYVYTDIVYDVRSWFSIGNNFLYQIVINSTPLTFEESLAYSFSGSDGDLVDVKFQDEVDPTCSITKTFEIRECSIGYAQGPIMVEYPNGSSDYYFKVKDHFYNVDGNTIYKIFIKYLNGFGEEITFIDDIKVPSFVGGTPTTLLPLVPITSEGLRTLYKASNDYPNGIPESVPATNYLSVAFSARNSTQCTAGTPNFETDLNPLNYTSYTQISLFRYDEFTSNNACQLPSPTGPVWISGQLTETTRNIIINEIPIYANEDGTAYAAPGYYATTDFAPGAPQPISRYWNGAGSWGTTTISC